MKKRTILASILTIALCICLISGSTFALFTSKSETNIAITAGTVNVQATLDATTLKTWSLGETVDEARTDGTYANKGSLATVANGELTLTGILPGDTTQITIDVDNQSNVSIAYRVTMTVEGELADALTAVATVNDTALEFIVGSTAWTYVEEPLAVIDDVVVTVTFPDSDDVNDYQGKECKVLLAVEAIQGNAEVVNLDGAISSSEEFAAALAEGGNYEITSSFEISAPLTISSNTNLYNYDTDNVITFSNDSRIKLAENTDFGLYGVQIDGGGSFEMVDGEFALTEGTVANSDALLMAYAGCTLTLGEGTVVENVVSKCPAVAWAKGTVDNRATIIFDGATVQNCAGGSGTVINVDRYGDVYIEEGTVIANNVSYNNQNHGIIRIYNDNWDAENPSTLTMNGGEIVDNYYSGNGLIGLYYADMTMNGGKINGNAWYVYNNKTNGFYCVAYVYSASHFTMNGGEIIGNTVRFGAINSINATVEDCIVINEGTITNNYNTDADGSDGFAAVCYPNTVEKHFVISDKANVTGTIFNLCDADDNMVYQYNEISEFLAD